MRIRGIPRRTLLNLFESNAKPYETSENSMSLAHFQCSGTVKGSSFQGNSMALFGSRNCPEATRDFVSRCMRLTSSSADSSCGSCSTNFPRTARSRMKRRKRGTASGASPKRWKCSSNSSAPACPLGMFIAAARLAGWPSVARGCARPRPRRHPGA